MNVRPAQLEAVQERRYKSLHRTPALGKMTLGLRQASSNEKLPWEEIPSSQ